jgi:hypothetical protein
VEKWWMRQVRMGQTHTTVKKSSKTMRKRTSEAEITPVDLAEDGADSMGASLPGAKPSVQMRGIDGVTGAA